MIEVEISDELPASGYIQPMRSGIQIAMAIMMRFSLSETKLSGTLLLPPTQFVYALHRVNRDDRCDLGQKRVVRPTAKVRRLRHQHQVGTKRSRLRHVHDVLHPERLGLARGDDSDAIRTRERYDSDWPTAIYAVRRMETLFAQKRRSVATATPPWGSSAWALLRPWRWSSRSVQLWFFAVHECFSGNLSSTMVGSH